MQQNDEAGLLMKKTIELLRGRDLLLVYKETNISYYWLRKFLAGRFANPSVNRVQRLYEYLSGKKITL